MNENHAWLAGADFLKIVEWIGHHQVKRKWEVGHFAQAFHCFHAKCDVGNKVTVLDVNMQVCVQSRVQSFDFLLQTQRVCGRNGFADAIEGEMIMLPRPPTAIERGML